MKWVRLTPQAEAAFGEIHEYSLRTWGAAAAEAYRQRIVNRLKALAAGKWPRGRSCAALFQSAAGEPAFAELCYYREGSHYLIYRERADMLMVVDMLHVSMDVERHLRALSGDDRDRSDEGEVGQ